MDIASRVSGLGVAKLRNLAISGGRRGFAGLLLGAALLSGACARPASGPELLEPQAKDHELERELVRALEERHSIASELVMHENDAVVLTSFRTQAEQWRITINSEASSKDGSHRVVMVVLDGDFGIGVRDMEKARALINEHNSRYWAGVFFIDHENDILGKWALNMPGVGMHPEMVADAVQRISQSWLDLLEVAQTRGLDRIRHAQRGTQSDPDSDLAALREDSI